MRVYSMSIFVGCVCGRKRERKKFRKKGGGGYSEKSRFEEALAPSKSKLRTCSINRKGRIFPLLCHVFQPKLGNSKFSLKGN